MRIIIVLALFLCTFFSLQAQEENSVLRLLEKKKSDTPSLGSIEGKVNDLVHGKPLAGAIVELMQEDVVIHTQQTNNIGDYSFSSVPSGKYILKASHLPDYKEREVLTEVLPSQKTILNFSLAAYPGTIAGNVTDEISGKPVEGALILIEDIRQDTIVASAVTDSAGQYNVPSLTPGSYTVKTSASHYQPVILSTYVQTKKTATLNIALSPLPGKINGKISDTSGRPIERGIITLEEANSHVVVATGISDQSGSYHLLDVPPGNFIISASSSDFEGASFGVTIQSNTLTTLNFILTPLPGIIVGQIRDVTTGLPIQGVIITVEVIQGGVVVATGSTDTNGNYTISELPPEEYSFRVNAPHFQIAVLDNSVQSDKTTILNFALTPLPGVLQGRVLDAKTRDPIQGAIVRVEVLKGRVVVETGLTDTKGRYQISSLPPGKYTIWVSAADYHPTKVETSISPSKSTTLNFALNSLLGEVEKRIRHKVQFD